MMDALETFVAVATAGNFSKVAKTQRVAVSSVARKIDSLEAELGSKLFKRSSRSLLLTDAGEHFLPRAQRLLADMADAKRGLSALDTDLRGLLTITAPAVFGRKHVLPALLTFLAQHPLVEVELHNSDTVVDVAQRRVDVSIRMGALPDSDLVATQLAPVRRLLCASPEYLERKGKPARPSDLTKYDCLTVASSPTPPGWWSFSGVNREAALPVRGSFRSDDTDALLQAALAGMGIVHLASWLVSDLVVAGRLVVLLTGFQKKTDKTPRTELARAEALKQEYLITKKTR